MKRDRKIYKMRKEVGAFKYEIRNFSLELRELRDANLSNFSYCIDLIQKILTS